MHVWYITIWGVHMWRHVRLIIKLRRIFKPSNLTTRKEGPPRQWWGIGGKKLDISKMIYMIFIQSRYVEIQAEINRLHFRNDASMEEVHLRTIPRNLSFSKNVLIKGSMILIVIMQHKYSNLFVFYNLYFLPNDSNQKQSNLGVKWKWHFKKDLILVVTFWTFADAFLWLLLIKAAPLTCVASNRMVSQLVEWSWSKGRLSKKIPKKCDGKRIRFEHTFGFCNICGSIIIFCLKGHEGSLDFLLIKQPSSLWAEERTDIGHKPTNKVCVYLYIFMHVYQNERNYFLT